MITIITTKIIIMESFLVDNHSGKTAATTVAAIFDTTAIVIKGAVL